MPHEFQPDQRVDTPETPAHLRPTSSEFRLHLEDVPPDDAASRRRSKAHQQAERQKVLDAMPNESVRERLRQQWADEDQLLIDRDIQNLADTISQHRFGCSSLCLPLGTREKVLALAKLGCELLGEAQ